MSRGTAPLVRVERRRRGRPRRRDRPRPPRGDERRLDGHGRGHRDGHAPARRRRRPCAAWCSARSHERAFCVGADLKERNAFTDADLTQQRPVARAAYGGVLDLPVPAIAAVDGYRPRRRLRARAVLRPHRRGGGRPSSGCPRSASASSPAAAAPSCSRAGSAGRGRPASIFTARRLPAAEALDARVPSTRSSPAGTARDRALELAATIAGELAGRAAQRQAGHAARGRRRPGRRSRDRGRLLARHRLLRRPRRGRRGLRREAPPVWPGR